MIGTLLCVFGSGEHHCKLTEEMHIPLRPVTKDDTWSLVFLKTGKLALLALVYLQFALRTRAETLASHGSDHLPVVFSLQKPGVEPRRTPQYPFKYGESGTGVMSKLRARKPALATNPRQKAVIQPPWWNKETQATWTDKQTMVKLWQKERSKPHPDPTFKAHMEEETDVFKRVASEVKDRQWKSFCDTLNRDTTFSHFWQFYRQMEGCAVNTNTPDLIDASGAVLKTSKEKGSALLQRFVQQDNQNNLDERKAVWKGLDRNGGRCRLKWRPDNRVGIHWSTF